MNIPAIIEFKAGLMEVSSIGENNRFRIAPDLRKGVCKIYRSDDELIHFVWVDRVTSNIGFDTILFPDDSEFKKVDTGKEIDRVFLLQYKNSARRFFFWLQDKNTAKDTLIVEGVNRCCRQGEDFSDRPGQVSASNAARPDGSSAVSVADLQGIFQSLGFQTRAPRAIPPAATASVPQPRPAPTQTPVAATPQTGNLTAGDLSRALHNVNLENNTPLSISDVVNPTAVIATGILDDETIVARLLACLPEGHRTRDHLLRTLRSAQLRQTADSLSQALVRDHRMALEQDMIMRQIQDHGDDDDGNVAGRRRKREDDSAPSNLLESIRRDLGLNENADNEEDAEEERLLNLGDVVGALVHALIRRQGRNQGDNTKEEEKDK